MRRRIFAYPYIAWMVLFVIVPLFFILGYAFWDNGVFSFDHMARALEGQTFKVLGHSALVAAETAAVCLLLGYPAALMLSRMKKGAAALLSTLFVVPMWMNFLLRVYALKILLPRGLLYTEWAVLAGMVYDFLPFMILPIYTTLQKLDKSYLEAAQDLGANAFVTFWRVVLPLSVPGIVSGITMVFVPSVTTFAISDLLGGKMTGLLFGDLIYNRFISDNLYGVGSSLSLVLMVFVLISMGVMRLFDKDTPGEQGGRLW